MKFGISALDGAICTEVNSIFTVIRHCLSDKVSNPITLVVDSETPITYAKRITQQHGKTILELFDKVPALPNKKLGLGWVFDEILAAGFLVRTASVRTASLTDTTALVTTALPHTLVSNSSNYEGSLYAGLSKCKSNAKDFLEMFKTERDVHFRGLIDRCFENVGDISEESWILRNPMWYKTLHTLPDAIRSFRSFLHAVLISHVSSKDISEKLFLSSLDEILRDTERFIELREDNDTTESEIYRFLNDIESYSYNPPQHVLMMSILDSPFSEFQDDHDRFFGTRFRRADSIELSTDQDRPEWVFLRELGEVFSAETVIYTDELPYFHVENILSEQITKLYNSPLTDRLATKGINLPALFPKARGWISAFMFDELYCSLIARRLMYISPERESVVNDWIEDHAHILLIIEDNNRESLGISVISNSLKRHLKMRESILSESEQSSILNLLEQWNNLKLTKPNRMKKSWKRLLQSNDIRCLLRTIMFNIIEMLHIPNDVRGEKYLACSRSIFFTYIDTLSEYLAEEPTVEILEEFLSTFPHLIQTTFVDKWDELVWAAPFRNIPTSE